MHQLILTRPSTAGDTGPTCRSQVHRVPRRIPAPLIEELGQRRAQPIGGGGRCLLDRFRASLSTRRVAKMTLPHTIPTKTRIKATSWRGRDNAGMSRPIDLARNPQRRQTLTTLSRTSPVLRLASAKSSLSPENAWEEPLAARLRPGQKVRHPKYGEGTVSRREERAKKPRLRYNSSFRLEEAGGEVCPVGGRA